MTKIIKNKKIGLALAGGGARGYSFIPLIEEFKKKGIKFDYVSGTSIGSVIGAYYCLNGEVDSLFKKIDNLSKLEWFKLIDFNKPFTSLIKGEKIKQFFKNNFFKNKTFEDLKIPLVITTTNLTNNKVEYITSGLLIDAIMASISIPGVFQPYKIGKNHYLDGGVKDNFPVNILFDKGMDKVIGIDLSFKPSENIKYNKIIDVLLNTFYMLLETQNVDEKYIKNLFVFRPEFKGGFGDILKFYKIKTNLNPGKKILKQDIINFENWI